jgi:hypothetical protein
LASPGTPFATESAQDRFAVICRSGRVSQVLRDVLLKIDDPLGGHAVESGHVEAQEHLRREARLDCDLQNRPSVLGRLALNPSAAAARYASATLEGCHSSGPTFNANPSIPALLARLMSPTQVS